VSASQTLRDFHVIALDSFTAIGGSDVEGRLAVFGDAAISNYSVSYVVEPPFAQVDVGRYAGTRLLTPFHTCSTVLLWYREDCP
jgi:hypothetical protein